MQELGLVHEGSEGNPRHEAPRRPTATLDRLLLTSTRWLALLARGAAVAVVEAALLAQRAQPVPSTAGLEVLEAADAVLALAALERGLLHGDLVEAVAALLLHERHRVSDSVTWDMPLGSCYVRQR